MGILCSQLSSHDRYIRYLRQVEVENDYSYKHWSSREYSCPLQIRHTLVRSRTHYQNMCVCSRIMIQHSSSHAHKAHDLLRLHWLMRRSFRPDMLQKMLGFKKNFIGGITIEILILIKHSWQGVLHFNEYRSCCI